MESEPKVVWWTDLTPEERRACLASLPRPKRGAHEPDGQRELNPTEALEMVWQLTIDTWTSVRVDIREQRMRRDVGRVIRRGR